ncbi:VOC family protein [uncultured Maricaulis sp.]|uniref:VOC family protein n=1 Tax=uncultured Maricaulis sp. TaxID=174710 RepID=UPI0030DB8DE9|tara:strand:- start:15452 stop:15868 length:417 start_codon:yes stop_codon:yes gene_type:complete
MSPTKTAIAPYINVRRGAEAIAFYQHAFEAEEVERYEYEGKIGHATLRINGGILNLADEYPEYEGEVGTVAPDTLGGRTTITIMLYVENADLWFDRAIAAGAAVLRPCTDEFYGRHGKLRDPFGHVWSLVTLKTPDAG